MGWRLEAPPSRVRRRPLILTTAFLAAICEAASASPSLATGGAAAALSSAAPEGFDALEQPQVTLVDVFFGGKRLGVAKARFTPNSIHFLAPEALMALIPHLKSKSETEEVLSQDLPSNPDRVCYSGAPATCGELKPAILGVIFDEARFRADLFLNPAYLEVDTPLTTQFLPAPGARPSALSFTNGVVSGSSRSQPAYGLENRTIISFGSSRLTADVFQASSVGFRVQTLSAAVDHQGYRLEGGLLQTQGLDFFGQGRFFGVNLGTQLDTLANRDQIAATPLLLYLDQRSQVEIYRSGRLLTSQTYEAGNQLIDTSGLPDGSYDITLKIRDAGGGVREERRSFTRSRALPPAGRPQLELSVGALLREDLGGQSLASAGSYLQLSYARRLTSALAIDGSLSAVADEAVAALGLTHVSQSFSARAEGLASGDGRYGVIVGTSVHLSDRATISLDLRHAWGEGAAEAVQANWKVTQGPVIAPADPAFGFTGAGTQATAALSYLYKALQLGVSGSYSSSPLSPSTYALGVTVQGPLPLGRLRDVQAFASAAETDRGCQLFLGLRFRLSRGRFGASGDVRLSQSSRDAGEASGVGADVAANSDVDTRLGQISTAGNWAHTADRDTVGAAMTDRSSSGTYGLELDHDLRGSDASTRYSAQAQLGLAFSDTHPAIGMGEGGDSGLIIDVESPDPRARFKVYVNNAPVATVAPGRRIALFLPAYKNYSVRLGPSGGDPTDFDAQERKVSLYPGNMVRLSWTATRLIEVFGRAIDQNGDPVSQAVAIGADQEAVTDGAGYFQTAISAQQELIFQRLDGSACRVDLAGTHSVNGYAALGSRRCVRLEAQKPTAKPTSGTGATLAEAFR